MSNTLDKIIGFNRPAYEQDLLVIADEVDAALSIKDVLIAQLKYDAEYMQWIADNAEIVTTGQGMRAVLVLNVFGNNNWSLRDYLSMEINGTMHDAQIS